MDEVPGQLAVIYNRNVSMEQLKMASNCHNRLSFDFGVGSVIHSIDCRVTLHGEISELFSIFYILARKMDTAPFVL